MNALVIVDVQNDFLPGGALAVARGDEVIAPANRLSPLFDVVVATRDWHPVNHGSFAASHPGKRPGDRILLDGRPQTLWPVHCVQGTHGAALADGLDKRAIAGVFSKGTQPDSDTYSGFFDDFAGQATGLADFLRQRGVTDVYVLGLATDYCVKHTALDAVDEGFRVWLVQDACRAVNLAPGDEQAALDEMAARGVRLTNSDEVRSRLAGG